MFFFNISFSGKKINFMHFERHAAFHNAYIFYFFPENQKKNLGFTRVRLP